MQHTQSHHRAKAALCTRYPTVQRQSANTLRPSTQPVPGRRPTSAHNNQNNPVPTCALQRQMQVYSHRRPAPTLKHLLTNPGIVTSHSPDQEAAHRKPGSTSQNKPQQHTSLSPGDQMSLTKKIHIRFCPTDHNCHGHITTRCCSRCECLAGAPNKTPSAGASTWLSINLRGNHRHGAGDPKTAIRRVHHELCSGSHLASCQSACMLATLQIEQAVAHQQLSQTPLKVLQPSRGIHGPAGATDGVNPATQADWVHPTGKVHSRQLGRQNGHGLN